MGASDGRHKREMADERAAMARIHVFFVNPRPDRPRPAWDNG
jgi:hypothetical protein